MIFKYLECWNILFTYFIGNNLCKITPYKRYQISKDSFIHHIIKPSNPVGNILLLQGGIGNMDLNSYYFKLFLTFLHQNCNVFVFEKFIPILGPHNSHLIHLCLQHIKTNFHGPITVVGFSAGGILLFNYLSLNYDDADLYIPLCCPVDVSNLKSVFQDHPVFRKIIKSAYNKYQVDDFTNLLLISGSNESDFNDSIANQINRLNYSTSWIDKTIYILGENDPLTHPCNHQINCLSKKPVTYIVDKGWHCCLDTIRLASHINNNFFQKYSRNSIKFSPKFELSL